MKKKFDYPIPAQTYNDFKAKREDTLEWVKGYFIDDSIIGRKWIYGNFNNIVFTEFFDVIPETISQSIGIKEHFEDGSYGEMIYYGDIVHCYGKRKYFPEWKIDKIFVVQNIYDVLNILHSEYVEIVGNIYDTPDFLKNKKQGGKNG